MAYQQVYDPLAYAGHTGAAVAQIGRGITSTVGNFFEQNAQWKQFKAGKKNDAEAKQKFWNTTLSVLQEKGINPAEIPGLNDINIADERLSPETLAEKVGKILEPHYEKLLVQKEINKFSPQKQDVMSQDVPAQPPAQPQPAATGGMVQTPWGPTNPDTAKALMDSMASDFVGPPAPSINKATPAAAPVTAPEPGTGESPYEQFQKSTIKHYQDLMAVGMLKPGDAEKLHKEMTELKLKEKDIELERLKKDREEAKATKEKAGTGLVNARISNLKIVDAQTGQEVNISPIEALQNPEKYAISKEHEQWKPSSPWGGGAGGAGKNPDELKLQKAVIDRLKQMNAADFELIKKEDNMGNIIPTYVAKPNTYAAMVLSDADQYNTFVVKYLPNYAKALGITAPETPKKGSGF